MSKSSHQGTGDTPQNQNNAMSDDPGDGQRKSFTAEGEKSVVDQSPEEQGSEQLEEFGKKGSKQD
ncbi:hypothetical protein ACFQPG_06730 [Sphingomonas sp. GCM10030256]|uniref:hypothetical protein n=1 Tax=Sphingomonas sp. GCM10030256 TaxID=3273427 RepID=UPI003616BC2A